MDRGLGGYIMLKVTMIIDNKIASPLAPATFVYQKVISKSRELFEIVEMKVEQGSFKEFTLPDWTSVDDGMPKNRQRVFVYFKNSYGKGRRTIAEYIKPETVLAEDFLDPDYSEDFGEYDEENDCYWTPSGFYESQYATEINYYISEKITHWQPLPDLPARSNV